ncbi:hypothetical protein AABB24_027014, partial [Solanum stoloniferum]
RHEKREIGRLKFDKRGSVGATHFEREIAVVFSPSGCSECYNNPKLSSSSQSSEYQKHQYQVIHKAKLLEDFWTASTCGMDKSVGLHLWNQSREQWIGNKKLVNQPQQLREPKLNWNATYDSLFGSNKPLPMSIPLGEMVDFLMDFWELEGLYD